jgi:hypothetical protein
MPLPEPEVRAKQCTNDYANKGEAAQVNAYELSYAHASVLSGTQTIAGAIENWVMKVLEGVVHDGNRTI